MAATDAASATTRPHLDPVRRVRSLWAALALLLPTLTLAADFVVGRETPLRIQVTPSGDQPCNIEIQLPDGSRIERELAPPHFETVVGYTPRTDGAQTIRWEGRFRFYGSLSVSGCSGRYFRDIKVQADASLMRERWDTYLAGMPPRQRECVEYGTGRMMIAGAPAPRRRASSPEDAAVKTVYAACERFANLPRRVDVPCPVSRGDVRETRCEDQYVIGSGRKARVLDPDAALVAAANGSPVTLALREPEAVRAARLEAERVAREQAAADEAARLAAEEKARVQAEEDARKRAEAEAEEARRAEDARKAALARLQRLRCIGGRCFDLGF